MRDSTIAALALTGVAALVGIVTLCVFLGTGPGDPRRGMSEAEIIQRGRERMQLEEIEKRNNERFGADFSQKLREAARKRVEAEYQRGLQP